MSQFECKGDNKHTKQDAVTEGGHKDGHESALNKMHEQVTQERKKHDGHPDTQHAKSPKGDEKGKDVLKDFQSMEEILKKQHAKDKPTIQFLGDQNNLKPEH